MKSVISQVVLCSNPAHSNHVEQIWIKKEEVFLKYRRVSSSCAFSCGKNMWGHKTERCHQDDHLFAPPTRPSDSSNWIRAKKRIFRHSFFQTLPWWPPNARYIYVIPLSLLVCYNKGSAWWKIANSDRHVSSLSVSCQVQFVWQGRDCLGVGFLSFIKWLEDRSLSSYSCTYHIFMLLASCQN